MSLRIGQGFEGAIDELRVWSVARSADQIAAGTMSWRTVNIDQPQHAHFGEVNQLADRDDDDHEARQLALDTLTDGCGQEHVEKSHKKCRCSRGSLRQSRQGQQWREGRGEPAHDRGELGERHAEGADQHHQGQQSHPDIQQVLQRSEQVLPRRWRLRRGNSDTSSC